MGFVIVDKKIMEWEWYKDVYTYKLFTHALWKANWKAGSFKGVEVPRGAFVTSLPKLAEDSGLSIQQTRTALKHLISTGELTDKSYSKFRIITVNNYDLYQSPNSITNIQLTDNQQTTNSQLTPIEQYNNITTEQGNKESINTPTPSTKPKSKKKKADVTVEELIPMVHEKNYSDELKEMLTTWLKYRVEIKDPVSSPIGFSRTLSRVDKAIAKHGEKALIDLIDLGISNNWHKIIFDKLEEGASNVQNDRGRTRADKKDQGATEDKSELYGTFEWYQKRGLVPAKDEGTAGDSQYPFRV